MLGITLCWALIPTCLVSICWALIPTVTGRIFPNGNTHPCGVKPPFDQPFHPLQCYTAECKHNPSTTHNHTRKIPISLNLYFSSNKGLHLSNKMHFTQNYNSPKWHRSSPRTASSFPKDGIQQTTYMHWISACQVPPRTSPKPRIPSLKTLTTIPQDLLPSMSLHIT